MSVFQWTDSLVYGFVPELCPHCNSDKLVIMVVEPYRRTCMQCQHQWEVGESDSQTSSL